MATKVQTPPKTNSGQNGEPTPEQKALAEATAFEEGLRAEADQLRDKAEYDGTLTSRLFTALRAFLTKPIPKHHIQTVKAQSQEYETRSGQKKKWPPHDMTGINGAQVQATRMSNILGRQHWRTLKVYAKDGQLVHVWVIVGNNLALARITDGQLDPNGADILASEDGYGGYAKGPEIANHYKGSETSAIKRVIARIGPGEEVYRQEADPELHPEDREAPAPEGERIPADVDRIPSEQVAELVDRYKDLKAKSDDSDKFAKSIKLKLGSMGVPTPSINRAIAALTPKQAEEFTAELDKLAGKGGES